MPTFAEDHAEVCTLLARYCLYLDLEQHGPWIELSTPTGEYHVHGRTFAGHDGLRTMITGAPGWLHLGGPPVVEVDGDRSTALQNLCSPDGWAARSGARSTTTSSCARLGARRIRSRRCRFIVADGLSDRPD